MSFLFIESPTVAQWLAYFIFGSVIPCLLLTTDGCIFKVRKILKCVYRGGMGSYSA